MSRVLKQFGIEVSEAEYIHLGHSACAGCAGAALLRQALKLLGPKVVLTNPPSCSGAYANALKVPSVRCLMEAAAASASGIRAALDIRGETDTTVLVWAGDGGTYDIGLQALSAAAERDENIIFMCYDNEGYMMTGVQRSSATPLGAWTTTTPLPKPKSEPKKNIMEIMAAHRIPYAATATIGYPLDFAAKINKAKSIPGTRFFNLFAPCPTGWQHDPSLSVKLSRLAVQSKLFPLYEVENGTRYTLQQDEAEIPVWEYLKLQRRFAHFSEEDVAAFQENVKQDWQRLTFLASSTTKQSA